MEFWANGGFDFTKKLKEIFTKKRWGLERMVDLHYKGKERILKKKEGVWNQRWIWLYKEKERIDIGEV